MKRILFIAAISLPFLWTACSGNKPEEKEEPVPAGMQALALDDKALHLDSTGFPVKINVPDSNFYPSIYATPTPNGMEVKVGPHFDILVNMGGAEEADLTKQKALITAQDAGVSTFSTSDSTTLVWETKFGDAAYNHFYKIIRIGSQIYYVRDNYDNADNQFKKEEVDRMLKSAESLHAKPAEAPKS